MTDSFEAIETAEQEVTASEADALEHEKAAAALAEKRRRAMLRKRQQRARLKEAAKTDADLRWNDPAELDDKSILQIWRRQSGYSEMFCYPDMMSNLVVAARHWTKLNNLVFNRFVAVWGWQEAIRARNAEQRGEAFTPSRGDLKSPEE